MALSDRLANAKLIQNLHFEYFEGIDWQIYESNELQHQYLKRNIGFALYGPPTENNILGYTDHQADAIAEIYRTICKNHFLQNTGELHIRIIYICLCFESDKAGDGSLPLFVLKKCVGINTHKPCIIFIDNNNRVYNGWTSFLENNKFPECKMICPKNGRYSGHIFVNNDGEEDVEVELEYHDSPACGVGKKVLNVTDALGTTIAVGTGITVAVAAIPAVTIAPVVLLAAGIGGIATGIYSVGRSIHNLVDRSMHQQSISLTNAESRNCWLNATVGVVSVGASGASAALTMATRNGAAVSNATKIAFNSLTVANVVGSGTNCGVTAFNFIEKLVNKERITMMDVFQLSSSILFFQMSVVNFRTANAIIQETQSSVLKQYEASLRSNRHRKIFNKAKLEARRLNGEVAGNAELIKGIQNIEHPNQFFAGLVKINKDLNKMGAKYTINAEGKVVINSNSIIDPVEFNQMTVRNRQVSLKSLPASTPGTSIGLTEAQLNVRINDIKSFCVSKAIGMVPKIIIKISENSEQIALLLQNFCQQTVDRVLDITIKFLDQLSDELEPLKKIHPLVNITVLGIQFVVEYAKRYAKVIHSDAKHVIDRFFSDLPRYMNELVESFKNWWKKQKDNYFSIKNEYIDLRRQQKDLVLCKSCTGKYYCSK